MAERAPRYTAYGERIAPLVDAIDASMQAKPSNQAAIAGVLAVLREWWPRILRRGWYGEIHIEIHVQDGILTQEIQITERRSQRVRE